MNDEKECKGCYLSKQDGRQIICTVLTNHKQYIRECPCRICLIKTMCCAGCDPFIEFKNIVRLVSSG